MKKSRVKKILETARKYQNEIDSAQEKLDELFEDLEALLNECEDDDEQTQQTVPPNPPNNPPGGGKP